MPTYEYVCSSCNNAWEEMQKISEPALEICPKCNQHTAKRQISGGNFILKGGGWYADLYSSTKPSGGGGKDGGASASSESKPASADKPASTAPAAPAAPAASSSGSSGSSGSSST